MAENGSKQGGNYKRGITAAISETMLQPLDMTTNASLKKMEKKSFRDYFTNVIIKEMLRDPTHVMSLQLRSSTLKPDHASVMKNVYAEKGI